MCGDISFLAAAAAWVRHGGERWLRGATAVTAIAVVGAGLGVFEWIGHGQPAASLEIVAATVTAGALAAAIAAVSAAPARSVRFVVVFATGFAALAIAVLMAPRVRELAGPICNALN